MIESIEAPIADYLPEYADLFVDADKAALRLIDLLPMTSGLRWDEWSVNYGHPDNFHTQMDNSPDPVRFVLEQPKVAEPGSVFVYNSGISITLGQIVTGASGVLVSDFLRRNLFDPLGMGNFYLDRYSNGTFQMGGGLNLRPRDMAKFGQLFLNGGRWGDTQVVSEEWVTLSTSQHGPNESYGYQWWLSTFTVGNETIQAFGAHGFWLDCARSRRRRASSSCRRPGASRRSSHHCRRTRFHQVDGSRDMTLASRPVCSSSRGRRAEILSCAKGWQP